MKYLNRTKFKGEIVSEFLLPVKATNKTIIFCSGMPGYPNKEKFLKLCTFFTDLGYNCFVPRYRGSWESAGEMFKNSPEDDVKDVISALSEGFVDLWEGKKYKIVKPEAYLVGASFGGPAVLLNSKDKRVKKVIAFCPVLDWRAEEGTSEPIEKLAPFVKEAFGLGYRIAKNGWKKIQKGLIYNPFTETEKIDGKKCLLIQTKDDDVVSIVPVKEFVEKTKVNFLEVKTGGHLGIEILDKKFQKKCLEFLKN